MLSIKKEDLNLPLKNNIMKNIFFLLCLFIVYRPFVYAQKITIQFDAVPSPSPSVSKAILKHNKDFAYSFTFDDATVDTYSSALPVLKGGLVTENGQRYNGFFYTDGCGNDIPFRAGIAWNTVNLSGVDVHTGNVAGQLTWKQLDTLYDLGWDVLNHSYSHRSQWNGPMSGNEYINEIVQNRVVIQNRTQKRIETPIFVVPSGDTFYNDIAYQQGSQLVFNQPGNVVGFGGLDISEGFNFDKKVVHRMLLEESLAISPTFLDRAVAKAADGSKIWYNEFTHRIDEFNPSATFGFKDFHNQMKRAADNWGKNGTDKMWMAPVQEVYEYLLMHRNAHFLTRLNGSKLDLTFDLYNVPKWLRRRTLTLVVNSTINFSTVTVPTGVKVTFKGTGNQKLINLDFTEFKTTGVFDNQTDPSVLAVFPNPIDDFLTVELPTTPESEAQLTVYDVTGKVVLMSKTKEKTARLNTNILRGGYYFLFIQNGHTFYRSSFVK